MNLSRFISHKTRKAHRQIAKALFGRQKNDFAEKFNVNTSKLTDTNDILLTLKNTLDSSSKSQIDKKSLNDKRKDILKAILGTEGAAYQLSKSIYTSRNSNFKKIFEEMKYESDQIYINGKTINDAQINTQIQKLQRYLKVTTDDDSNINIEVRTNKYTDINNKFKEGGLVAQLKILVCLLLLYYLTAEKEAKTGDKDKSKSISNPSSNPRLSPPRRTPPPNKRPSSITTPNMPPVTHTIVPHNFKPGPPPYSWGPAPNSSQKFSFHVAPPPSISSSSSSSSSAPRDLPAPKVVHPSTIYPEIAPKDMVCYSKYTYKAAEIDKDDEDKKEQCKQHLVDNVNSGIKRLGLNPTDVRINANNFFGAIERDPRRGIARYDRENNKYYYSRDGLASENNYVYDLPEKYCHIEDYSGQEPICVTDTSSLEPATLWNYSGFSLPAIFAVNNALNDEGKGELNPNSTAVQSAGNATSPGGDAIDGKGTQEESLHFDSEAYLFLNTKRAYEEYYLKNKQAMEEQLEASKKMRLPCSVDAWNKTGIFSRGVYSSGVGLRGGNGATINIITTAAADYNKGHGGTYMGPIEDSDGTLTSYKKQLITYWNTILRIAYNNGNRNIVLTTGGGGAYRGINEEIISALFTVLTQCGPKGSICWARCFDNIIFASESRHAEPKLCQPYKETFGDSYVKQI